MDEKTKSAVRREEVKKCMNNKDRIMIILPLGTIDSIN